ncbi:hypothetical protein JHK87_037426 [Glycine soja]|nr:hypothetical protein JHK87_037426 [Glycine soja]
MAAAASSFGTTCRLRRAAQAFAISHSHILRSNANLSLQRNFCSHLTVSTSSGLHLLHLILSYDVCFGNLGEYVTPGRSISMDLDETSGVSQTVQALKGEVDLLLKGVGERSVMKEVKHILEMARRASLKREILHTYFLTPPVLKEYMQVLEKLADVKAIAQGGYPQGEQGAQIIVVPELVEFLMSTLVKVRNVPASCTKIPLISLDYEPPSNGDVRINWIHVTTKGTTLKSGDIVSVSGKGRLKIGEINSTKKGKFAVELIQYL